MKRFTFFLAYFLTPVVPAFLYLRNAAGSGAYPASVALGVAAFILVCDQFILASRPAFAVSALGLKGLLAFHGTMPFAILALAGAHKLLKGAAGYSGETTQALFGAVAWWVFAVAAAFALVMLATTKPPLAEPLKRLRTWISGTFKIDYKTSRIAHNVTVLGALSIAVHALLASSSALAANPIGAVYLAAWLAISLGLYAAYRVRGRKAGGGTSA
ncbi:MAG: hypothetical protein KKA67_05245 [Spirochaetes bacterium]|nr:hypothetical protein [Spirochaetota bacterium]MBU1079761.1 hypothetical protein [Spirochaetota bacterium]